MTAQMCYRGNEDVIMLKYALFPTYRLPEDHRIRWVITVPAIWSQEARQFMRKAAKRVNTRYVIVC